MGAAIVWRLVPVLIVLAGAACRPPSGLTFSEIDANAPRAQALIAVAQASELRVRGLSSPPSSGTVTLAVPEEWAKSRFDPRVSYSVMWKSSSRSAEWDFHDEGGKPELVCWTEWHHSPFLVSSPDVADGDQFFEQLRITSGSAGACGGRSGFVVEHWGSHGIRVVGLEEIPQIVAEWERRKGEQ